MGEKREQALVKRFTRETVLAYLLSDG